MSYKFFFVLDYWIRRPFFIWWLDSKNVPRLIALNKILLLGIKYRKPHQFPLSYEKNNLWPSSCGLYSRGGSDKKNNFLPFGHWNHFCLLYHFNISLSSILKSFWKIFQFIHKKSQNAIWLYICISADSKTTQLDFAQNQSNFIWPGDRQVLIWPLFESGL